MTRGRDDAPNRESVRLLLLADPHSDREDEGSDDEPTSEPTLYFEGEEQAVSGEEPRGSAPWLVGSALSSQPRDDEWDDDDTAPAGALCNPPGALRRARWTLVCRRGGQYSVVDLREDEAAELGRGRAAIVQIDDPRASRRHARVWVERGALQIEDLGSRNGTLVAGRLLRGARQILRAGTPVRIADCEVVAVLTARPAATEGAGGPCAEADLVVGDPAMDKLVELARRVARMPMTTLLVGETGVGKDVLARHIHAWSARREGPFVRVDCGAIGETLLECELFGHEKGAFTGADQSKIGLVEAASGGTLFLDEIADLSPAAQSKLLTVIEHGAVTRLGAVAPQPLDVRIVCATRRDLAREIAKGRFRADLYYRLSAFALHIPPLRERIGAVGALAHAFVSAHASAFESNMPRLSPEVLAALTEHSWPGNVRELRNAMEHAMVLADGGTIEPQHLPPSVRGVQESQPRLASGSSYRHAQARRTRS